MNGIVPKRSFCARTPIGDKLTIGSDRGRKYSRLDYFLIMYPPEQLRLIVSETNKQLVENQKSRQQLEKFLSCLVYGF
jgi:hypothetical protein